MITVSPQKAHKLIKQAVKAAVKNHNKNPVKPLKWDGPFVLEKCFMFTESVDRYKNNPLAEIVDARIVRLKSKKLLDIIYT